MADHNAEEAAREELDNLRAFRPNHGKKCTVCGATPVVSATGLCGPCTFGEADTINGEWWSDEDEAKYQRLTDQIGGADD